MTTDGQDIECRIYFEDTDAGGVVYYANYLKYYERGRTEFLRSMGFEQDQLLEQNLVFVVRNICVDYRQPARFNDLLRVNTRIESLRKVGLVFVQSVFRKNNNDQVLLNSARVEIASLSADRFRPCAIPQNILEELKNYE